ncbi:MAG: S24 family peptidase [Armatimonadetes bacterium]|nr:S24 family peptidase [Candidatus Hippobium faecium]
MSMGEELKKLILGRNKSLSVFARNNGLNVMTLTNIINKGPEMAGAVNVYKICKGLDIDFSKCMEGEIVPAVRNAYSLTNNEYDMLSRYRALDEFGTRAVDDLLRNEFERVIYNQNTYRFIYKPFPDMPVSAGEGMDLQSDGSETLKIKKTPEAEECDFVLRVRGDSMEPKFYDGDVVLVKCQPAVDIGQIGIFILNGEGFMKEMGAGRLISLNRKYDPIAIKEYDEIKTVGRVLGKAELE